MDSQGYDLDNEEIDGAAFDILVAASQQPTSAAYDEDEIASATQHFPETTTILEPVRGWLQFFYRAFENNNVYELSSAYDNFSKLTDKHFQKTAWPSADVIAPLVKDDQLFLILYRELFYRHVYAKLQPTLEDRFASYENYCNLFNIILNSDGPVELDLPNQWAWDIVDEFVFQFQNYCSLRTRLARRVMGSAQQPDHHAVTEDVDIIKDNTHMWSCYSVLNVLYSLINKSNMNNILAAMKAGENADAVSGEYGVFNLYRMLGYFSIIGLLRVHTLLGDFTLALKMLDNIELNKKALFARVTSAHYQTYYYVGFCYMMLHRYADAVKAFNHILPILSRNRHHNRNSQYDQITKKGEQMFALLAICLALSPARVDDQLHATLRERYNDQQQRMARGGTEALATFEELFLFASPKFINPIAPDFESVVGTSEPVQHHLRIFLKDAEGWSIVQVLKSYLKLYSSIDLAKLAVFVGMDETELRKKLLVYKQKSRQYRWVDGPLLAGSLVNTSDIDFQLENVRAQWCLRTC